MIADRRPGTRIRAANGSALALFTRGRLLVSVDGDETAVPLLSLWDAIARIDRFEFPLELGGLPIRRERLIRHGAELLTLDELPNEGNFLLAPLAELAEVLAREGYPQAAARVRQIEQARRPRRGA